MNAPDGSRKFKVIGRAPAFVRLRPVERDERPAGGVPEIEQAGQQPIRQGVHATVDHVQADVLQEAQADVHRGEAAEVHRAVFERGSAVGRVVTVGADRRHRDRAAGEPRAAQFRERGPPGEERADARRVAEHLVERQHDEVGVPAATGPGGWWARRPRRRAGRPIRGTGPRQSTRVRAARRRSWTAPDTRTGCAGPGPPCPGRPRRRPDPPEVRRHHGHVGRLGAPCDRANSRIPFTELWLSKVRRNRPPGPNGYDSPTSFRAWLALPVKMTQYSSGDALKNDWTCRRASLTSAVERRAVGLSECGFPSTSPCSRSMWRRTCEAP